MAIDSVSSAGNAYQPVQQPNETRVASEAKRTADQAVQATKVDEQRKTAQVQREQQAQQSPPPKPVVNTQGQATGQLLNEIA
jgi:hypothetical protein